MTSYDRHATPDSPYRTGRHVPLEPGRHAPLTSIATSGLESRPDLTYVDDSSFAASTPFQNGRMGSPHGGGSPTSPYSPGMRSSSATGRPRLPNGSSSYHGAAAVAGEIPLQNFQDGLPPPPPVAHSWKRIDRWAEENYTELHDQLAEGATVNDLNELEYMLDSSLPADVRESLQIHDGQERGGMPTGIIFSCMLLDCEEIVQEWRQWRTVNQEFLSDHIRVRAPVVTKPAVAAAPSAASSSSAAAPASQPNNPLWRQELLAKQESQPPDAVRQAYAHPGWIPLARDWGGNNIAVDLAPGPAGTWGQIIVFGRDYDCKIVAARSWAAFLASVADDLEGDKWLVDDETQELRIREFKSNNVEPTYLEILRHRADQKYGRRGPRRKPAHSMTINAKAGAAADGASPKASPLSADFERGRTLHRFAGHGVGLSPKSRAGRSSPLAKVSEDVPAAVPTHTGMSSRAGTPVNGPGKPSKLIEAPTPAPRFESDPEPEDGVERSSDETGRDSPATHGGIKGLGVDGVDAVTPDEKSDAELKTVDL